MSEKNGYIHKPRGSAGEGDQQDLARAEPNDSNQLTIFYAGSIAVFEGVTPDKAQAIVLIASAAAASRTAPLASPPSEQSSNSGGPDRCHTPNLGPRDPISSIHFEVPHARRNSLHVFLEKRRARLANKGPYTMTTSKRQNTSPESHTGSRSLSAADGFDLNGTATSVCNDRS